MTICHLELPSLVIHRDSDEARKQLEREKVLELSQQRRRRVIEEEQEETKAENIDLKKKVKNLKIKVLKIIFGLEA